MAALPSNDARTALQNHDGDISGRGSGLPGVLPLSRVVRPGGPKAAFRVNAVGMVSVANINDVLEGHVALEVATARRTRAGLDDRHHDKIVAALPKKGRAIHHRQYREQATLRDESDASRQSFEQHCE